MTRRRAWPRAPGWALALCTVHALGCGRGPAPLPPTPGAPLTAPDSFDVTFETTKGTVVVRAHRAWSPHGVDRFYELVRRGFYDGVPVYRVVPGYVAQFGTTGVPARDSVWRGRGLPDEEVRVPNTQGRLSFARGGPQTRTVQLFFNLANNSPRLDTLSSSGIRGYPPIGEVVEGLDVVLAFESKYGNEPSRFQDSIRAGGVAWLEQRFPGLDRIVRVALRR